MKHKLKSLQAAEVCDTLEWTNQELNLRTYMFFLLMFGSFINLATNGILSQVCTRDKFTVCPKKLPLMKHQWKEHRFLK